MKLFLSFFVGVAISIVVLFAGGFFHPVSATNPLHENPAIAFRLCVDCLENKKHKKCCWQAEYQNMSESAGENYRQLRTRLETLEELWEESNHDHSLFKHTLDEVVYLVETENIYWDWRI